MDVPNYQDLFTGLLSVIPTPVLLTDETGVVRAASDQAERLFGCPAGGLDGRDLRDLGTAGMGGADVPDGALGLTPGAAVAWTLRRANGALTQTTIHRVSLPGGGNWRLFLFPATDGVIADDGEPVARPGELEFRLFLDHAPFMATIRDREGRYLYANPRSRSSVVRKRDAVLGTTASELFNEQQAAAVRETDEQVLSTGRSLRYEQHFTAPDGSELTFLTVKFPLADERGAIYGVGAIATDVTELSRVTRALRESEDRFRQIAETIDSGVVFAALDPIEYLYASPSALEICAVAPEDSTNRSTFLGRVHPDDLAQAVGVGNDPEGWDGHSVTMAEVRLLSPDGSVRWVRSSRMPPEVGDDGRRRAAFLLRDITEEKAVAEALEQSHRATESALRRLDGVLEASTRHAIIACDETETITIFNRGAELMLGRGATEFVGRGARELMAVAFDVTELSVLTGDAPDQQSIADLMLRAGQRDWIWVRADGRRFPVEITATPVIGTGGEPGGVVCIARDVTQSRRQQADLVQARERAVEADRAKSEFLSRVSHELRTPLNAILGFSELLGEEALTADQCEFTSKVTSAGRHLLELVNELLDLSRVEAGRLTLSLEPVSLDAVVSDAVGMVRPLAEQREVRLVDDVSDGAGFPAGRVIADEQRLKQVVLNLLTNAVKYNRSGGEVRLSVEPVGNRWRLVVSDTGIGIAAADRDRVFEPFVRLDEQGSGIEGTGLGLALSRALMTEMGGEIDFTAEPGRGSRFWIVLERAGAFVVEGIRPPAAPPAALPGLRAQRTILYIEDNEPNRQLVEAMLRRRGGVRLLTAALGGEGVELARTRRPDLILLDLHLPDIDGEELLSQLREDPQTRGVPVIVVSADATVGQRQLLGAAGYLIKPFTVEELLAVIGAHPASEAGGSDASGFGLGTDAAVGSASTATGDGDTDGAGAGDGGPSRIDRSRLHSLLRLQTDADADLVDRALADAESRIAAIAEALEVDDGERAAAEAHGLISSASMLGGGQMARLAMATERAARSGTLAAAPDISELGGELTFLRTAVGEVTDELRSERSNR